MSSAGRCIARSTSSGILVGPGSARNSRPARTTIFVIPLKDFSASKGCRGMAGNSSQGRMILECGCHAQGCFCERIHDGAPKRSASLPSGLAAAGGFGLFDRAEPARALGYPHFDLGVPSAGRLVIDTLAGMIDVALD